MANKRNLKKQIQYICGDVAAECLLASCTLSNIDTEKMREIVLQVADLQTNALERSSFAFDKSVKEFASAKEYRVAKKKYFATAYRTMTKEFNDGIEGIIKQMNDLLPKSKAQAPEKEEKEA